MEKKKNYPTPVFRKLKGYAFDPSFSSTLSKRQSNEVVYKIPWEETEPGPCGEYVEIIDYDPTKRCFYKAISLQDPLVLADQGLNLSEGDPRFHQQQVYTVVMSVIYQFEKALGRKIIWSRIVDSEDQEGSVTSSNASYEHRFVAKLRIYPHAMRQQNAFYSPAKNALLFGYFKASSNWNGNNVPGSTVFTCLSPDIVSHETTHAILHSIHPYLTEDTNPDMLAFHEGLADIIALLQRFTFRTVVEEQIRYSRGDLLSTESILGDLAIQFGQAVSGNRRALRSFLVEKDENGKWRPVQPDPQKIHQEAEPHNRGAILVAAIFDAFARLYKFRVADLIRLATNGTGVLEQGEIDPDLVKRLSKEACEISEKLMHICIRALDYCPPTDLTFGDYLRALITADVERNPDDEEGLRFAVMESFRNWGIIPGDVNTFSAESLEWQSPDEYVSEHDLLAKFKEDIKNCFDPDLAKRNINPLAKDAVNSIEKILRENDRCKIFKESRRLCALVHNVFEDRLEGKEKLLGMNFKQISYDCACQDESGNEIKFFLSTKSDRDKFQVFKCRPLIVSDPGSGDTIKTIIITFLQKVYVDLRGSKYQGYFKNDEYAFRGGASMIIDLATCDIDYIIMKSLNNASRLVSQLNYAVEQSGSADNNALLMQSDEPFAALHLH
ncbi:hypothetical protein L0663_04955 [Dyadobacter sp. CY107]|uniref:hypothetical protein n=1 Tax=Dyadobacter fanqingshengii TaxID=2906443 RepID=UPI001F3F4597|nr:hypothetical protein [Dyadobacter fanqingshengii]MCF2502715.1 hypothetical protein [Dyadobacter fanqingshengii]